MFWWRQWTAQCWRWRWRLWKLWQLSWGRQECICRVFFRWVCWYHLGLRSSPVAVWVNVLCSGTCGWDRRGYSRASFPPTSGKLPEQWSCGKQQVIAARTWCSRQACTTAAVALSLCAPFRLIRIINIRLWIVMGFLTVVGTDRALRVCWAHVWVKALFRYCDLTMLCWREGTVAYFHQKSSYFRWCCLPSGMSPALDCASCLSILLLRKDHLSCPPVPYEELQKLLEAVLKRCADLSPPQSSKRHAVSQKLVGRTEQDRDDLPRILCGCFIHVPSPYLHPQWLFGSLLFLLIFLLRDGTRLWSRWRWMLVNVIFLNQWSSVEHHLSRSLCV